ncbi:MAG: hypothetical protein ACOC6F_01830 [bacterium]
MRLIKIECELRYRERMRVLQGYEALYADVMGREPERARQWAVPGLRIEDKERKRVVLVDPARSVIAVEQPPDVAYCRRHVTQFFDSVNKRLTIPKIGRCGLRSTWVEEHRDTFSDLLATYKERLLTQAEPVAGAQDVAAVLEYGVGSGQKVTVTTGPMEKTQLQSQYLTFELGECPEIFLYIDSDFGDVARGDYSRRELADFFDRALSEGEKRANEIVARIRGMQ